MKNINDNNEQIENMKKRIAFLFEAKKYELAIKESEKLLEYEPDNYNALLYIASCYSNMEKYDRAESAALELVRAYPESSMAYGVCGRVFCDKGEYRKSIDYCKKSIELDPYDAFIYYIMSFAFKKAGGRTNLCKAAELIDKALEIEPDDVEFHLHACGIYYNIGEYHKAKEEGEKALQINPNSSRAHLKYGCALIYLGYLNESLEHLYIALKLNPNDKQALQNIDVVNNYIEDSQKYYDFLEERFFERDSKYENSSKAVVILAEIYIVQEKYFNALRVLKRYLRIMPHAVDEHINYARMLYDKGALAEALHYIKALKKQNPKEEKLDEYIKNISTEMKKNRIKEIHFCMEEMGICRKIRMLGRKR